MVTVNDDRHVESIGEFGLSKEKTPIAYENKVKELTEECGMSREEAEASARETVTELEIMYEKGQGIFAVDSEALGSRADIFSPYTGMPCRYPDDKNPYVESLMAQRNRLNMETRNLLPEAIAGMIQSFSVTEEECRHIDIGTTGIENETIQTECPRFLIRDRHSETLWPAQPGLISFNEDKDGKHIILQIESEFDKRILTTDECTTEQLTQTYNLLKMLKRMTDNGEITARQTDAVVCLSLKDKSTEL